MRIANIFSFFTRLFSIKDHNPFKLYGKLYGLLYYQSHHYYRGYYYGEYSEVNYYNRLIVCRYNWYKSKYLHDLIWKRVYFICG